MASLSTLRDNSFTTMQSVLEDETDGLSTSNIHSSYNDRLMKSEGYPQVIINQPDIDRSTIDFNNSLRNCIITLEVEVRHSSAENLRKMMDEVNDTVKAQLGTFRTAGFELEDEPGDEFNKLRYAPQKTQHIGLVRFEFRFVGS